ncbi:MAG: hypothetical protein L0922_00645, partial [Candidatus Mariimomonas ferrooxydans]
MTCGKWDGVKVLYHFPSTIVYFFPLLTVDYTLYASQAFLFLKFLACFYYCLLSHSLHTTSTITH